MSKTGITKRTTSLAFGLFIIVLAFLAAYVARKFSDRGAGADVPEVIEGTVRVAPGAFLPRRVTVRPGGVLVFPTGSVRVPKKCGGSMQGALRWPASAMEQTKFFSADQAVTAHLAISFAKSGTVQHCSLAGYNGPVGDPRMRLAVAAEERLDIVGVRMQGVGHSESKPVFQARSLSLKGLFYSSDNRSVAQDNPFVAGEEIIVDGLTAEGLTGYASLFDCKKLDATNVDLKGVMCADMLVRGCDSAALHHVLLCACEIWPIKARKLYFERCTLANMDGSLECESDTLSITDSIFAALGLSLACENIALKGGILCSPDGSISLGKSETRDNMIAVSATGTVESSLLSVTSPDRKLFELFANGKAPEKETPDVDGTLFMRGVVIVYAESVPELKLHASARCEMCVMMGAEAVRSTPEGFKAVIYKGKKVPGEMLNRVALRPGLVTLLTSLPF
ncbi:MAG: hypothetical protein U5N86_00345 [Planctomycetota bacterium]|nr:hypothetical protein [Planctomycetota bacterium]